MQATAQPKKSPNDAADVVSTQQAASTMSKIFTAIADGHERVEAPKEGLIRAFRKPGSDADSSATSASYGSDRSAAHSSMDSEPPTAPTGGLLINPSEPIQLNANRMLALSPTMPQSMARSQWRSYDYHILEKLYTGYASKVYKAVCKRSNETVVLKSYQLSAICELYQHQIFREVGLHAALQHENVVTLSAAFQEGDFVVMVQEYAAGGNLFELLQKYGGRLNEHVTVQMILEPFLRVLQYLHTRGIVHRDIKPENILFSGGMTLKLADFGLAIDLRRERAVTRAGTLDYMAPEVLNCPYKNKPEENKEKAHLHYSSTVDSWAVGVLAYELLVGCPPFYDSTRERVEQRIRSSTPNFPRTMSENARSFITAALTKDPSKRPSVLQLLHHPWISMYRARRSMRQINMNLNTVTPALASPPVSPSTRQHAAAAVAAAMPSGYSTVAKAKSAFISGNLTAATKIGKAPHGSSSNVVATAAAFEAAAAAAASAALPPLSPASSHRQAKAQAQRNSSYALSPVNKGKSLKTVAVLASSLPASAAAAATTSSPVGSNNSSATSSSSDRSSTRSSQQQPQQMETEPSETPNPLGEVMSVKAEASLVSSSSNSSNSAKDHHHQQQQQQQGVVHSPVSSSTIILCGSSNSNDGSSTVAKTAVGAGCSSSINTDNPLARNSFISKAVPMTDEPVESPKCPGNVQNPRVWDSLGFSSGCLSTNSFTSPFKTATSLTNAANLITPRDPAAAAAAVLQKSPYSSSSTRAAAGRTDASICWQLQSAKSSPLLVSDVRDLHLGEPGYGEQLQLQQDDSALTRQQRKKWLRAGLGLCAGSAAK